MFLHGGPYDHYINSHDEIVNKYLKRGYIVLLPNPSGSTGYGKEFNKRITITDDQINMGKKDIDDLDNIVEYFSKLPYIDKDNLVVTGGSYGGYLTWMYALRGKYRDQIKKIIPIFSITSFEVFTDVEKNQVLRHIVQAFVMENLLPDVIDSKNDEDTKLKYNQMLKDASPLSYIEDLETDTFIVQSANDLRTPRKHTDLVVDQLKKIHGDDLPFKFHYEVSDNFGHSAVSDELFEKIYSFLEE